MMAPAPKLLSISSNTRANAFFFASAAPASAFASVLRAAAVRTTRALLFDAYARVASVARTARARADVVVVIFNIVDRIAVVIVVDAGSVARARLEMVRTLEDVKARAIARLSMRSRVPSRPFARDG
jgi:hypothetical protein